MSRIIAFIAFIFSIPLTILAQDQNSPVSEREKLFTDFYNKTSSKAPFEGVLLENAQPYIDFLQAFLQENEIRSVVEVGCGDWRVSRYISWGDIQYNGIDIVKPVIEENKKKYGSPTIQFTHADACAGELPSADLLICKDVLQHLSNQDIAFFLKQTSKYKHCLLTNDITDTESASKDNQAIKTGGFHSLNLGEHPFEVKGFGLFSYACGKSRKQVFYIKNANTQIPSKVNKSVLLAILAKNKAHMLPKYLESIDNLDYDKKLIVVYIRTNNNKDDTRDLLADWVEKHRSEYQEVIFEDEDIDQATASNPHQWSNERLKLLAEIRNRSLEKAKEYKTDFYFVADCDNFVHPHTLKYLVQKDKPMIAPMLRSMPRKGDPYSNFFADVDARGYWKTDSDFYKILNGAAIGTFKVPLVHCTYLIKTEYLDRLNYMDDTSDMEFVIISRLARKYGIDQFICNEREFGTLYHPYNYGLTLEEEIKDFTGS